MFARNLLFIHLYGSVYPIGHRNSVITLDKQKDRQMDIDIPLHKDMDIYLDGYRHFKKKGQ